MRWKGIIFIVIIAALLVAGVFIFSAGWVETAIENSASEVNGAKVEIDNLDLSLFDLSISWDKLQIANPDKPMKNSFETGKTELNLEFMPLIRGKVVIDTIEFMDLATNTDRKTSGELVKPKVEKKAKKAKKDKAGEEKESSEPSMVESAKLKMESKGEEFKNFRLDEMKSDLNVDELLKATDLASLEYIESARKDMEAKVDKWNTVINSDEFQKDYDALEKEFVELSKIDPKKIKNVKDLQKAVKQFNKAKDDFDTVNKKVKKYQKDFEADFKEVKLASKEIDSMVKNDYKEIEKVAKIPDIDTKNIAAFVFGDKLVDQVNQFFVIVEKVAFYKKKLDSVKGDKEKPKRGKGQDIDFSTKYQYPDFWIKNVIFSGSVDKDLKIDGKITDIVNDQSMVNKTTIAKINGQNPDNSKIQINANIDTRTKKSFDTYQVNYIDFPLSNITISKSEMFPYDIAKGNGQIETTIKINNGKYDGKMDFYGTSMEFRKNSSANSKSEIQKFLDQSVQNLASLNVKCKFSNDNISINSNIDDIYNKEIKNYLDKNIKEAKAKVQKEIDAKVNEAKSEYEKRRKEATAEIDKKLNTYKAEIDKQLQEINDKKNATEAEIKKKGDDALKKGEKALKNLF